MYDILDIIKLLETLNEDSESLTLIKNFEKVVDELNLYTFKNWEDGELIKGPEISKYNVKCWFMWPRDKMPDPQGMKILSNYGCEVKCGKSSLLVPRKIQDPDDFRPGTKKGKIDATPVWVVSINMPKKLIQDITVGQANKDQISLAELEKYNNFEQITNNIQQGTSENEIPT